jgi:hypothetical protein
MQVTQTKNKNQAKTKQTTKCALDTTIRTETRIRLKRHEPSYKQLDVKTNQPSFEIPININKYALNP